MIEEVDVGQVIPIRNDRKKPLNFVVARNSFGQWIVTERRGLYGGIFASRDAAVRFVNLELCGRAGTLSIGKAPLELFAVRRRTG